MIKDDKLAEALFKKLLKGYLLKLPKNTPEGTFLECIDTIDMIQIARLKTKIPFICQYSMYVRTSEGEILLELDKKMYKKFYKEYMEKYCEDTRKAVEYKTKRQNEVYEKYLKKWGGD